MGNNLTAKLVEQEQDSAKLLKLIYQLNRELDAAGPNPFGGWNET